MLGRFIETGRGSLFLWYGQPLCILGHCINPFPSKKKHVFPAVPVPALQFRLHRSMAGLVRAGVCVKAGFLQCWGGVFAEVTCAECSPRDLQGCAADGPQVCSLERSRGRAT